MVFLGLDRNIGGLDRFGQGLDKVWTGFGQALDSLWTAFAQALDRLGEGKECLGEFLSGKTVTQAQSNTVSTLEGSTDPLRPSRFVRPASSPPASS